MNFSSTQNKSLLRSMRALKYATQSTFNQKGGELINEEAD